MSDIADNTEAQERNTEATDRNTESSDTATPVLKKMYAAVRLLFVLLGFVVLLGAGGFFYFENQEDERQARSCQVLHDAFDAHTAALIEAAEGDADPAVVERFNEQVHDGIAAACH